MGAGEAIRDVADARKNGNPMMIRQNPSQGPGQMQHQDFAAFFPRGAVVHSTNGQA
jgi:hypothetical protein